MVKLTLEIANLVGFKALKDFVGYMKHIGCISKSSPVYP